MLHLLNNTWLVTDQISQQRLQDLELPTINTINFCHLCMLLCFNVFSLTFIAKVMQVLW